MESSTIATAVAPGGNGAPGHDADRLAGTDRSTGRGARRDLVDHDEFGRRVDEIDRPHGVPVDGAVVERRDDLARHDVGRQHEPEGRSSIDVDRGWFRAGGPHQRLGLVQWRHLVTVSVNVPGRTVT